MHLEIISNGLGAPSIRLLTLAAEGLITAEVSITADTGAEEDRLWSNGRRTSARRYYDEVVVPFCEKWQIQPYFVRAESGDGQPLPSLWDAVNDAAEKFSQGDKGLLPQKTFIPLFGSDGGRLRQSCTQRWKVTAIRQQARRLGATTMRAAQGIHFDEAWRRTKGIYIAEVKGWDTYYDVDRSEAEVEFIQENLLGGNPFEIKGKAKPIPTKWATHYYPLAELKMGRDQIKSDLDKMGIPYLISSECDHCPHKDLPRWDRTSPDVIDQIADLESKFYPQFFFTDERIPLKDALAKKRDKYREMPILGQQLSDGNFDCTDGVCGV